MVFEQKRNWLTIFTLILFALCSNLKAQTLPVGNPGLEEYYRRLQLLGLIDSNISFIVRPLSAGALKVKDIFNPDTGNKARGIRSFADGKGQFQVLPIALQTQYNARRPYGWNDGPMIPARGLQSMLSAGVYVRYGPLSIQLRPEAVYAQNKDVRSSYESFPGIPREFIDIPDKFGEDEYTQLFTGQSSVRLTYRSVSLGVSSENLWWSPGIRNSLLMSNTAPGFTHITLNTTRPISTIVGSFEGQLIGAHLKGSGFTAQPADLRYLSGFTLSYQPSVIPGLFLGITRSLQMYDKDAKSISDYVPLFKAFNSKSNQSGQVASDQLFSLYTRWLWKQAQAEVYFEYSRGDHAAGIRDYTLEPEHSRAYLFGFQKLVQLKSNLPEYLQINVEVTHLLQGVNYILRNASSVYTHYPIKEGYTHFGQFIGAGIGPGNNAQIFALKYVKGLKNFGVQLERQTYLNDYYPAVSANDNERNSSIGIEASVSAPFRKAFADLQIGAISSWQENNIRTISRKGSDFYCKLGIRYPF